MAKKRIENINPSIIDWAITRAGNDLDVFYGANPDVLDWKKGKKKPTLKQLENFTRKVHVPFGYMFISEPPSEEIPIPFFRTGVENPRAKKISLNVYHTILITQERQNWLTNYLQEKGYSDLDFVGKYGNDTNYKTIADDIRKTLDLSKDWASKLKTWEESIDYLTSKIEEIGIIINFSGIVGSNTSRKISFEECRGFVLVNKKAPFLFINSADAKAAQMFTLIHELAHIWLGKNAGFDNKQMLPANDPIEILCDQVAAEFLVPEISFKDKWKTTKEFKKLSRFFKVSPIVIGRRALDLGYYTKSDFFSFYNNYMMDLKTKKELKTDPGGNFYATAKKRISLRFASYVDIAVKENNLLYRDAYSLTSLKGDTYKNFINKCLYQV